MIPRKLGRIVTDDPALAVLWERTRQLRELQFLYATLVPPYLRAASRVGSVAREELKLLADSGAVATRLRLLVPDLLREFRAKGREFSSIRVAVQVRIDLRSRRGTPRAPLDEDVQARLLEAADDVGDTPLGAALRRLARKR